MRLLSKYVLAIFVTTYMAAAQGSDLVDVSSVPEGPRPWAELCDEQPRNDVRESQRTSLEIALVSTDKTSYEVGSPITFEVQLRNTGNLPVLVPIALNVKDVLPQPAVPPFEYSVFCLNLQIDGVSDWIVGRCLYALHNRPGTWRSLAPGDFLVIRATTKVALLSPEMYNRVASGRHEPLLLYPSVHFSGERVTAIEGEKRKECVANDQPIQSSVTGKLALPIVPSRKP